METGSELEGLPCTCRQRIDAKEVVNYDKTIRMRPAVFDNMSQLYRKTIRNFRIGVAIGKKKCYNTFLENGMRREVVWQGMKKQKKIIRKILLGVAICLIILLLIPVLCYGIVCFGKGGSALYIQQVDSFAERDAAIVPGTSALDGAITEKAKDRLHAAIRLYEEGIVSQIIVSGEAKEGRTMTQYLMRKGIPAEALATDIYGVDTYDTLARVKEKFGEHSYYFCTQKLYGNRAGYLMRRLGLDGTVVCVDTMRYARVGKNMLREFLASTKAVGESFCRKGKAKTTIETEDFIDVEEPVENPHLVYADELETPENCVVEDVAPDDGYDVVKAVEYAREYAFERNVEYGQFEENCTNFVSQCLVAGGISMKGDGGISEKKRWNISDTKQAWYSKTEQCDRDGLSHYAVSSTFINTDAFLKYFTEVLGYSIYMYDNEITGRQELCEEAAAGDVLILYKEDGSVAHLGLISGIGDKTIYYCGNTSDRRDFSVFRISTDLYAKIGLLHMSETKSR